MKERVRFDWLFIQHMCVCGAVAWELTTDNDYVNYYSIDGIGYCDYFHTFFFMEKCTSR